MIWLWFELRSCSAQTSSVIFTSQQLWHNGRLSGAWKRFWPDCFPDALTLVLARRQEAPNPGALVGESITIELLLLLLLSTATK